MLFNSVDYLYLILVSFTCYWIMPSNHARTIVLLLASAVFYMSWSVEYYVLLVSVLVFVWWLSVEFLSRGSKGALTLSIVTLLSLLFYFKYTNFFIENIVSVIGAGDSFSTLEIILPLGVSFYVFQIIAYCVDVYKGKVEPEKNLLIFIAFITFFPQLIAGPICRAKELMPQLEKRKSLDSSMIFDGVIIALCGLCLKVAIADRIAPYVNVVFDAPGGFGGLDNLLAVVGFGVQILCDFWGYSLIAIGSALFFGLRLPHNFNLPYASLSIAEFWRRWHITLGSWLRDYLYIPLGGNRGGRLLSSRNLLITMLLGGLWHGASWNFIVWGGIHGFALVVNRYYRDIPVLNSMQWLAQIKAISWLLTILVVFSSWVFFRADSFQSALSVFYSIFDFSSAWLNTRMPVEFFEVVLIFIPLHLLIHYISYGDHLQLWARKFAPIYCPVLSLVMILYYQDGTDFIYFQF